MKYFVLGVLISLLYANNANADDAGSITGWRTLHFGMRMNDAKQYCDPGDRGRVIILNSPGHNGTPVNEIRYYGIQLSCKNTSIGPFAFKLQLLFTLSDHLYQVSLNNNLADPKLTESVLNDLSAQYGAVKDSFVDLPRSDYCWPFLDGQTNLDNRCVSSANIDELFGHRIVVVSDYKAHINSLSLYYYSDEASFQQWVGEPPAFRLPGS
jgi:hypothetical protein